MLPSSQTPPSLRRSSSTSRLAQSHSTEAGVDSNILDDESDIAIVDIDGNLPEEHRRRKIEKERRTDLHNDSPALYNLVNRSTCLRRILMD
jgi:hypothetical protein